MYKIYYKFFEMTSLLILGEKTYSLIYFVPINWRIGNLLHIYNLYCLICLCWGVEIEAKHLYSYNRE